MLTYFSNFLSGDLNPLWTHFWLLLFCIGASCAVGAGIIFEGPKYSVAVHNIAFWLVIVGIAVEAISTILLFVFDEGISNAQQSTIERQQAKIIVLEKIIAPRHWYGLFTGSYLGAPTLTALSNSMSQDSDLRKFPKVSASIKSIPEYEAKRLASDVSFGLQSAGWVTKSLGDDETLPEGVHLATRPDHDDAWQAAEVLARSLSSRGVEAETPKGKMHLEDQLLPVGVVLVSIGARPAFSSLSEMAGEEYRAAHPGEK